MFKPHKQWNPPDFNHGEGVRITENKENVKIASYEAENIKVKDIHEVQKTLDKDVTTYQEASKNDIIYSASKNNKGDLKSVDINRKVKTEMKSQRSQ